MSVQATGVYWPPSISNGQCRCGRAAYTDWGARQSAAAITANDAARRVVPRALVNASCSNQLPVRIARGDVAGKSPNIGDIGDLIRVPVDDGARFVAGDRDHLRDEAD